MRILLVFAGGQVTLFQYKRVVPDHFASSKMAQIASQIFNSWQWGDGDVPAIDAGDKMILLVDGPTGSECSL